MLRSCVIPTQEFDPVNIATINECCANFYKLFEELFGVHNCPYNLHVICSHLLEIRTHGPLTETSAFKFESFYGELRRSFVPGTESPLKQILKKTLLKRVIGKHVCLNNIYVTNYETSLECNNLIYRYDTKDKKYLIYQVADINGKIATCNKIGQYPAKFPEVPNLDWSSIGVFRKGGVCSDATYVNTSDISGKVLVVGNFLITCPNNVLHEK